MTAGSRRKSVVVLDYGSGNLRSAQRALERVGADVAVTADRAAALACDGLARAAGLVCDNGVVVDETARTSDPAIWAIGDMTFRPIPAQGGRRHRLESVPNALEQAKQAASAITGRAPPTPEVPWFWSDQYDLKLQIAGIPFQVDQIVVRGDPATRKFAVFHLSQNRVQAVEAINAPPEFIVGRQWLASRREIDVLRLADVSIPMKEV